MSASVAAGSNHVGAKETWIAQVNWPLGAAAHAMPGAPLANPRAVNARTSRRVRSACFEKPLRALPYNPIEPPPHRGLFNEPCCEPRAPLRKCLHVSSEMI